MGWVKASLAAVGLVAGMTMVTPLASQPICLHGQGETPEQLERRKQAIAFSRAVHNEQVKVFRSTKAYVTQDQLSLPMQAPEGFQFKLAADAKGYAFSVVDQIDPCKFGFFSNEAGLIFKGEALQ